MSNKTFRIVANGELSRRKLLKTSALATGGLFVGAVLSGCDDTSDSQAETEVTNTATDPTPVVETSTPMDMNAYVQITPDNEVSIVVPGAELGQGVYTTLPKILAEELEADWSRVSIRQATADAAYGNPNKDGRQVIGNSDSVVGYYDLMRQIGAATKEMLITAAANSWSVETSECRAKNSRVYHDASDRSLSFGELANLAANIEPPETPVLKAPSEFQLIGITVPRKDTPAKIDGSAIYGTDLRFPDGLVAAVKMAPVFGSRVTSFDGAAVEILPGVEAVVEVDNGVAVIAKTYWQAKKALDALPIEFSSAPNASLNSEQIFGDLRAALDEEARAAVGNRGAALAVLEQTTDVLEAEYEVPILAHACMEPMAAAALVTDDACTLWAPHQRQGDARQDAADVTGLPLENVIFQGVFAGGGFGRKWELDFSRQAVQAAKAVKGRHVTLIWSREEDIQHDYYRPAYVARARSGFDEAGELVAMHVRLAGSSILSYQDRPLPIVDPTAAGDAIEMGYAIPNAFVDFVERPSPVPIGFWRSVSKSHNGFISESIIDECAHSRGQDPYQYRRNLLEGKDRELAVLDMAAEKAGWGEPLPENSGRGIAFSAGFGSITAQVAEITVENSLLRIKKVTCVVDCGVAIDPDTVDAQMEGGICYGLSAALFGEITLENGAVVQSNFHDYQMVNMAQMPQVETHIINSGAAVGGVGEAATPGIMPALTNAIFAATGQRIRKLPITASGLNAA